LRRHEVSAGGAIEEEELPVARSLREELARLAVHGVVYQHGRLGRGPIWRVVRRRLEMPRHLPCVWIQRDDAAGEEIRSLTVDVRVDRMRIAGRDVNQVEIRVVGHR